MTVPKPYKQKQSKPLPPPSLPPPKSSRCLFGCCRSGVADAAVIQCQQASLWLASQPQSEAVQGISRQADHRCGCGSIAPELLQIYFQHQNSSTTPATMLHIRNRPPPPLLPRTISTLVEENCQARYMLWLVKTLSEGSLAPGRTFILPGGNTPCMLVVPVKAFSP